MPRTRRPTPRRALSRSTERDSADGVDRGADAEGGAADPRGLEESEELDRTPSAGRESREGDEATEPAAGEPRALPPGQLYKLGWAFYLALALGGVVWIGWREGRVPLELFVDRSTWPIDLGLGLAAAATLIGVWELARKLLPRAGDLEARFAPLVAGAERGELLALALLSGFAEELFFRGAVQGSWGFLLATALFALVHTGPGPAYRTWTLFAAVAGAVLGGLMAWRGNLLAPVVAHAVVNGVNLPRLRGKAGD